MNHKSKKALPWKTLTSKVIFTHPAITLTQDSVKLPNGTKSTYIRQAPAEHHSVIMVAQNIKGEILVQREYSYPPNKVMWQLPGGSMKPGEDIETAALRELAEESGFSAHKTQIIGSYYTQNRLSDQKQYVVLCTQLYEHQLAEDHDEFIETYWFTKQKLTKMISNGDIDNINLLAALNIWLYMRSNELSLIA
jgi:ADP-ribose pyrophosphatase